MNTPTPNPLPLKGGKGFTCFHPLPLDGRSVSPSGWHQQQEDLCHDR